MINLAKQVEEKFKNIEKPLTIAVMGCPVNGPGEAKHADIGISGANGEGYVFKQGKIIDKIPFNDLLEYLENEISKIRY